VLGMRRYPGLGAESGCESGRGPPFRGLARDAVSQRDRVCFSTFRNGLGLLNAGDETVPRRPRRGCE